MLQFGINENGLDLASFFLSDLIGSRVYDRNGRLVGRVSDVFAATEDKYPQIDAFVVAMAGLKRFIPIGMIDLMVLAELKRVTLEEHEIPEFLPRDRHFLVRDLLYDRQIVDVNGAKVERVNDVLILCREGRCHVARVDVGFTGLSRRLGFERAVRKIAGALGKELQDELIDWKFVQPLPESYIGPLAVSLRKEQIKELHAGELADILEELDRDERRSLVESIGAEDAAEALEETDIKIQTSILRDLDAGLAADILEEMEPAVAADVIEKLPEDTQESIMAAMEDEDRDLIKILVHAREDSAASLMTVDFISCPETHKASDALDLLREYADDIESITYIYCTDDDFHLKGVVSLRELILTAPETLLSEVMNRRLITLSLDQDWDSIAGQFLKLRFKALPVVDQDGRILGIVTFVHSFLELLPYYYRLAGKL